MVRLDFPTADGIVPFFAVGTPVNDTLDGGFVASRHSTVPSPVSSPQVAGRNPLRPLPGQVDPVLLGQHEPEFLIVDSRRRARYKNPTTGL